MKRMKRIFTLVLCLFLLVGVAGQAVTAFEIDWDLIQEIIDAQPKVPFTDVPRGSWYEEAVAFCLERGIMNGVSDTLFQPDGTMTRAMIATVLHRMSGSPAPKGNNPFTDVDAGSWYGPAVIWAAEQGYVQGYGNGLYGPMDEVSRQQLAVFLWRYAGSPKTEFSNIGAADRGQEADWAKDAVAWCIDTQIIAFRDGRGFYPLESALRCELADALMWYILEPWKDGEDRELVFDGIWDEFEALMGYLPRAGTVSPNTYDMDLFSVNSKGYMTYSGRADTAMGIDVSSHQKKIDWEAVADAGVEFAMIRVGYRGYTAGSTHVDEYFEANINGALDAGLDVGVYFFSQAISVEEALEEAEFVLDYIEDYPITFPVVFDWERQDKDTSRTKNTTEEVVLACAIAFCDRIEEAGYTPMFYASPSKAYAMDLEYLSRYPFWLAHYTKNMAPTSYRYHFDIWQYTSKGRVPGVNGDVDINIAMRNF